MLETELKKNTAALEALTAAIGAMALSPDVEVVAKIPEKEVEAPKKEVEAPKKEAAPVKEEPAATTKEDVLEVLKQASLLERAVLNEIAEGSGTPAESKKPAMAILKKYGATALSELKEEDYSAAHLDLTELVVGYE